jgi:hypothetical protein
LRKDFDAGETRWRGHHPHLIAIRWNKWGMITTDQVQRTVTNPIDKRLCVVKRSKGRCYLGCIPRFTEVV